MKKLFLLSALLIGTLTFGQTKTKDIDKDVNVLLDSLSKVYHMRVGSIVVKTINCVRITSISYSKNGKLTYKVIKTEKNPTTRDIFGDEP
jgi:hypothetical protein